MGEVYPIEGKVALSIMVVVHPSPVYVDVDMVRAGQSSPAISDMDLHVGAIRYRWKGREGVQGERGKTNHA